MHITSRSYLTAGIATLGVGALALAPVQPIPHQLDLAPQKVVSSLAVDLAAAVDPITAWVNVFQTSAANIAILNEFQQQNPFPLLKTIGANIATYIEEISNGQIDLVFEQIGNNIQTFFEAPWDPGTVQSIPVVWDPPKEVTVALGDYLSDTQPPTPATSEPEADAQSPSNANLFLLQLTAAATQTDPTGDPELEALTEFLFGFAPLVRILNTPATGQIISWIGPVLSPLVALTNSFTAVGKYFQEGKILDAFYELVNIPANMTNAFLNGAGFLNLAPVIGQFFNLPEGLDRIGVNLGGLLNAMPQNGSLKVNPVDPQPARPTVWAGGTGFDSFAIPGCSSDAGALCGFIAGQPPAGLTNGLFGAGIGLGQFLAEKLLITPPTEAPASAKLAAPEAAAPALPEAPAAQEAAPVEAPVKDTAPADFEVIADDPAPAEDAGTEAGAAVVSEDLEVEAPADFAEVTEIAEASEVAADSAPEATAAVGSDDSDSGDTGRASDSRRGAADAD
ncbi:MAG: hypothetical protein FGM52_01365 [Mycobacterium sp.]|nr:hypothetical protein [Mycobacterium sp.]